MKNIIVTDEFINTLEFQRFKCSVLGDTKKVDYETFKEANSNLAVLWNRLKNSDLRKQKFSDYEGYISFLYRYWVENIDYPLAAIYLYRFYIDTPEFDYTVSLPENGVLVGKTDSSRFFRKFMYHSIIYLKAKAQSSIVEFFRTLYQTGKLGISNSYLSPFMLKHIELEAIHVFSEQIMVTLKTVLGVASIFPQNRYRSLLSYTKSLCRIPVKNLLVPTASWGVPVVASEGLGYEKVTIIDVIPEVLESCHDIKNYISKGLTFEDFSLETLCVPSQKVNTEGREMHYQQVFFCPPYFDLEDYSVGEQSTSEYPEYESWLNGYWRGTCKKCDTMLQSGGTFTFVVSNLMDSGKTNLAEDMKKIAEEYFTYIDTLVVNKKLNDKFYKEKTDWMKEKCEVAIIMRKE